MEDFIVDKDGSKFIDVVKLLPEALPSGKKILWRDVENNKIELYIPALILGRGHDSKKIYVNRFIELDNLFFEGLGLWQGEGGKGKGLYFGNNCLELILHFLNFVEEKIDLKRNEFKVTMNSPNSKRSESRIIKKWSIKLGISINNFTKVCFDPRINREYVQLYINGIVLTEIMKILHRNLRDTISKNQSFSSSYLRGIFASEGSVVFKDSDIISHVDFSSKDLEIINFIKDRLSNLGISHGSYSQKHGMKFQINGRRNFEKIKEIGLFNLHPEKQKRLNIGLSKYERFVMKGYEMEKLILQQLNSGPKTYDEISKILQKGRSTIQSHYIPILESKGLIQRYGKRKQAWLFCLAED